MPRRPAQSAEAYEKSGPRQARPWWRPAGRCGRRCKPRRSEGGIGDALSHPVHPGCHAPSGGAKASRSCCSSRFFRIMPCPAMKPPSSASGKSRQNGAAHATDGRCRPTSISPITSRRLTGKRRVFLKRDYDHLLFSFHGIRSDMCASPTRPAPLFSGRGLLRGGQPGSCDLLSRAVFQDGGGLCPMAGIPKDKHSVAFQSRLGRDPWLKPYTDQELAAGRAGRQKTAGDCPAFVSDCLETLKRSDCAGRETFLGGRRGAIFAHSLLERAPAVAGGAGK